jgi:hypothetical protein
MLKQDPNDRINIPEAKMILYFSEVDFPHLFDLKSATKEWDINS